MSRRGVRNRRVFRAVALPLLLLHTAWSGSTAAAWLAHELFHLGERLAEHQAEAVSRRLELYLHGAAAGHTHSEEIAPHLAVGDGGGAMAPAKAHAVPHSHSPGGELHTHSPGVDALLTLAEAAPGEAVDAAPTTAPLLDQKVPASLGWSHGPSGERALLFVEQNPRRLSNSPLPQVPPPRG